MAIPNTRSLLSTRCWCCSLSLSPGLDDNPISNNRIRSSACRSSWCVFGSSWFISSFIRHAPLGNHRYHHITHCNSLESLVLRSLRVGPTKIEILMLSHHRPIHKLRTIVPVNVDVHGSSQNNLAKTPKYRPYFAYVALSRCSTTQNEHEIGRK